MTTVLSREEVARQNSPPSIEPWIGVDDLARVLGVSADWVYERAASGELPSYKFGGHRRFRISEVEEWASGCTNAEMTGGGAKDAARR